MGHVRDAVLLVLISFFLGCPPYVVNINTPFDGEQFEVGEEITFNGSAQDFQAGELTGNFLVWTSSIDGKIGTGIEFSEDDLSEGIHEIILTATNSSGEKGTATVTICVGEMCEPYINAYSNSGCLGSKIINVEQDPKCGEDEIIAESEGKSIYVTHKNATYDCCPEDIKVALSVEENHLKLTEELIPGELLCDCRLCCYNIETEIAGLLPGKYTIEVCWYDRETHRELCRKTTKVVSN